LLPLVLVLAALQQKSSSSADFAVAYTMALLLVVEFRLWDDLCDVEVDRLEHPDRVLCQLASLGPFWGLVILLAVINFGLAVIVRAWWAAAPLMGLHVLLAVWYGWGRADRES